MRRTIKLTYNSRDASREQVIDLSGPRDELWSERETPSKGGPSDVEKHIKQRFISNGPAQVFEVG